MSTFKQKLEDLRYNSMFPWIVAMIVMIAIVIGLFVFDRATKKPVPKKVDSVSKAPKSYLKNFETAVNLEKVSDSGAIQGPVLFAPNDEIIFTTQDQTITSNKTVLQTKEKFDPISMFMADEKNTIINQVDSSYQVVLPEFKTASLPSSIYSVVPLLNPQTQKNEFYYLQKREKSVTIKTASDLSFGDSKTITNIEFSVFRPDRLEIKMFKSVPYLASQTYSDTGRETLRIYKIGTTLEKKLELTNVKSIHYSVDKILLNIETDTNNGINTEFKIIDFANPDKPVLSSLDFRGELGKEGIYGLVVASRCSSANGENRIVCLVKRDKNATYQDKTQADAFVDYNLDNQEVKILIPNLYISAHSVLFSPSDELYLFGQENNLLYKVKQN
jgi:hypothetical protein